MFQTLQSKLRCHPERVTLSGVEGRRATLPIAVALLAATLGTTFVPSQTYKAGTKIQCVTEEKLDSSQLSYGDKFKLQIVDTSLPALHGGWITGWITDVKKPSGGEQGHVGFYLTSLHLSNGQHKQISAYVVNRRVKQYNPAAQYAARQQLSPMAGVPVGTVTPGPIAWQMNLGSGPSSVKAHQSAASMGGYVYASASQWPIIVNAGTSVTVELAENVTIP